MLILYIFALAGLLVNALVNKPVESAAWLGIVAIGIPVYFYRKKKIG